MPQPEKNAKLEVTLNINLSEVSGKEFKEQVLGFFNQLIKQGEKTMATFEEVQAELSEVKGVVAQLPTVIANEKAEVVAKVTELEATVQALKDQLAANSPVTQAQLDGLAADVAEVKVGVGAVGQGVADIIS